jgi:hypothetical protein
VIQTFWIQEFDGQWDVYATVYYTTAGTRTVILFYYSYSS